MIRYRLPLAVFFVLIAVALPLLNAARFQHSLKSYPIIRVPIEPYDPRDLLYGQYLRLRIMWNLPAGAQQNSCQGKDCCLCLEKIEGSYNPPGHVMACPLPMVTPPDCRHLVKGKSYGSMFDSGLNRFYVDEKIALPLEKIFREKKAAFSLGVVLHPDGNVSAERLYVDGEPLDQYRATHPEISR